MALVYRGGTYKHLGFQIESWKDYFNLPDNLGLYNLRYLLQSIGIDAWTLSKTDMYTFIHNDIICLRRLNAHVK